MTQQAAVLVQIGQLLTKSGLISHELLADALIRAKERQLPIGTVLLTMGCLNQKDLRAAVEAQSMVNDSLVSSDLAIEALMKAASENVTLDTALTALGWQSKTAPVTNRLGELLTDAGIVSDEQLTDCLSTSLETGMPLGRVLIFKRILADDVLLAALRAQRVVREGVIPRDDAVNALREVQRRKISLEQSLEESGLLKPTKKRSTPVGFLLVEAGFLPEVNLMMCVEMSLSENRPVVDLLVEQGYVSRSLAEACLEVQQLLDARTVTKEMAVEALKVVQTDDCSVSRAVAKVGMPEWSEIVQSHVQVLFVLSGIVEARDMPPLEEDAFSSFKMFDRQLTASGKVERHMIDGLVRALYLVEFKTLELEDAVMALHFCRKNRTSLDEALTIMGWKGARM